MGLATKPSRSKAPVLRLTGVKRFVSMWDEKTLGKFKQAEKVDVTDLLLGAFALNEKQLKAVAGLALSTGSMPVDNR